MDADRFIVHIKIDNIYKVIVKDVEIRFDIRYLKEKIRKLIRLVKDGEKSYYKICWSKNKSCL